ncbi:hypothetical protein QTH97_07205 [Variovorax sp. J22R24]|uniref:DUF6587 family protein n=1 Tax=Variovorax gracilis TaxID=3053502 RepID=UPI00257906DC|nr:DUF6587 family protein [Variovorax sp. J22R24]MDM0104713.1 hypothetical protein [Variovorax sp. J22R24]
MTQQIVVALIVALAAIYAVWRWMPRSWRRVAATKLAAGSQRAGLVDAEGARQLAASLGKTSGCGSCDTCGNCSTGAGSKTGADVQPPLTRSH